ncbi:hypothetical protein MTX20_23170 [Bradyrhizobium sp. ISRA435]|nr:hypothetical protein MTX20_23170 [Bradyrhizobium sp. ISRA435]
MRAPEVAGDQRTGEIAGKVGGAEIDGFRRREPFGRDQCRDQRRIGEARKPEPDQRGAEPGSRRQPHRPARILMRRGVVVPAIDIGRHGPASRPGDRS